MARTNRRSIGDFGSRTRGRRRRKGGLRRALGWLAFMPVASRVPTYTRLIWALVRDDRVPASRKAVLAGALGYVVSGRDLIPDELPFVGGLDDLAVVVLAVEVFLDGVPQEILDEKLEELEIDVDAFERDMDHVRRLTPSPIRRVIRRIPDALDTMSDVAGRIGIGSRLRSWINKEEPFA
jgi:uncharacterized membrane protein YkvA (DUF1232 family)